MQLGKPKNGGHPWDFSKSQTQERQKSWHTASDERRHKEVTAKCHVWAYIAIWISKVLIVCCKARYWDNWNNVNMLLWAYQIVAENLITALRLCQGKTSLGHVQWSAQGRRVMMSVTCAQWVLGGKSSVNICRKKKKKQKEKNISNWWLWDNGTILANFSVDWMFSKVIHQSWAGFVESRDMGLITQSYHRDRPPTTPSVQAMGTSAVHPLQGSKMRGKSQSNLSGLYHTMPGVSSCWGWEVAGMCPPGNHLLNSSPTVKHEEGRYLEKGGHFIQPWRFKWGLCNVMSDKD